MGRKKSKKELFLAFVANGVIHDYLHLSTLLQHYDRIIAVDGGLKHCHQANIVPDLIVGDMDSAPQDILNLYSKVEKKEYPTAKDETDLEIALKLEYCSHVSKMSVFGAMEGRVDHSIYNLHLLARYPETLFIETEGESLFVITKPTLVSCKKGQTVSLLPIGEPAHNVTTIGLQWELQNATLNSSFMSISNICLDQQFHVSLDSGCLLCSLIRSKQTD